MEIPSLDEVAALVREQTNFSGPVTGETVLQWDVGAYGDDLAELLLAYGERFGVDMSGYLWYFHTWPEGGNFGGVLFRLPNECVREMPITVGMLQQFAAGRRWALAYPAHDLPPFYKRVKRGRVLFLLLVCLGALITVLGYRNALE